MAKNPMAVASSAVLALSLESKDSVHDDDELDVMGRGKQAVLGTMDYLYELGAGLPYCNGMFEMRFRAFFLRWSL